MPQQEETPCRRRRGQRMLCTPGTCLTFSMGTPTAGDACGRQEGETTPVPRWEKTPAPDGKRRQRHQAQEERTRTQKGPKKKDAVNSGALFGLFDGDSGSG
mmetsp:Transcript_55003/g.126326  ORF Transcript_55003/g.126326 Transcript_55003/m.126326 type:complete len:101 (+) Transcript_55003:133-435(+)